MLYRNSTKVLMKVKMCITKHIEAVLLEERIYLLEKKNTYSLSSLFTFKITFLSIYWPVKFISFIKITILKYFVKRNFIFFSYFKTANTR